MNQACPISARRRLLFYDVYLRRYRICRLHDFLPGMAGRPMGNFYEDMVRNTTRILIPSLFIAGMLLIWQGTPQNFHANFTVSTLEGKWQDIAAR